MSDVDEQIAALLERRAQSRAEHDAAHKLQHLADLTALVALEEEHGVERLLRVEIKGWKSGSGAVAMVVAKRARKSDKLFSRFVAMMRASKKCEKVDDNEMERAANLLAESCIVYPAVPKKGEANPDGAYEATLELAPGLLTNVAGAIVTAAMGKAEEEGKG